MTVDISAAAIREGRPRSERLCALALALRVRARAGRGATPLAVAVYRDCAVISYCRYDRRYRLTGDALRFVRDYDAERRTQPCTLDLGEPELWDREGGDWARRARAAGAPAC